MTRSSSEEAIAAPQTTRAGRATDITTRFDDERALTTGRLAAGVAYALAPSLRSLKPSLLAALEILEASDAGSPSAAVATVEAAELVRDAIRSAELADETLRGLATFASPAATTRGHVTERASVHEALELAIQLTSRDVGARATLVRRYSPVDAVRGSLPRLAAVFVSLLRNAAEAVPPYLPHANRIWLETHPTEDGAVSIEVGDTGVGIEPDDLPYVFDPFFTTKPRQGVPGLGLTLARAEVAALGGTIDVTSEAGRGTRVRVTLPAAGESDLAFDRLFSSERLPSRRVLCVASTTVAARELGRLVEDDEDADVTLATWDEAVERLALGDAFDLVLTAPESNQGTDSFRARLRNIAPEALVRTFQVTPRSRGSGTFRVGGAGRALGRVGT